MCRDKVAVHPDALCPRSAERFNSLRIKSASLFNEKPHKHKRLAGWVSPLINFTPSLISVLKTSQTTRLTHKQNIEITQNE